MNHSVVSETSETALPGLNLCDSRVVLTPTELKQLDRDLAHLHRLGHVVTKARLTEKPLVQRINR